MIKHLLFDLDMTLLDFLEAEKLAFKATVDGLNLIYSQDFYEAYSIANEKCWKRLELKEITKKELYEIRFSETLDWYFMKHGKVSSLPPLQDINSMYINNMCKIGVLLPGAMEFVLKLKKSREDLSLYIITNGTSKTARGRVNVSGLEPLFKEVFVSDEIGVNKPDKRFFEHVFDELKCTADECLVIGDSLSSDMLGAKNAGIKSLWYTNDPQEESVNKYSITYTASSFDEMLKILEGIN